MDLHGREICEQLLSFLGVLVTLGCYKVYSPRPVYAHDDID